MTIVAPPARTPVRRLPVVAGVAGTLAVVVGLAVGPAVAGAQEEPEPTDPPPTETTITEPPPTVTYTVPPSSDPPASTVPTVPTTVPATTPTATTTPTDPGTTPTTRGGSPPATSSRRPTATTRRPTAGPTTTVAGEEPPPEETAPADTGETAPPTTATSTSRARQPMQVAPTTTEAPAADVAVIDAEPAAGSKVVPLAITVGVGLAGLALVLRPGRRPVPSDSADGALTPVLLAGPAMSPGSTAPTADGGAPDADLDAILPSGVAGAGPARTGAGTAAGQAGVPGAAAGEGRGRQ